MLSYRPLVRPHICRQGASLLAPIVRWRLLFGVDRYCAWCVPAGCEVVSGCRRVCCGWVEVVARSFTWSDLNCSTLFVAKGCRSAQGTSEDRSAEAGQAECAGAPIVSVQTPVIATAKVGCIEWSWLNNRHDHGLDRCHRRWCRSRMVGWEQQVLLRLSSRLWLACRFYDRMKHRVWFHHRTRAAHLEATACFLFSELNPGFLVFPLLVDRMIGRPGRQATKNKRVRDGGDDRPFWHLFVHTTNMPTGWAQIPDD